MSSAVSGPAFRLATMRAVAVGSRVWNGAASLPAWTLGLDDERNWALLA